MERPTAIILGGGGARAAYQVGALRAIAELVPRGRPLPFPIVCGTSAGAINAATLAIQCRRFPARSRAARYAGGGASAVADIYRADFAIAVAPQRAISRRRAHRRARTATGVASLLDNTPMSSLLLEQFEWPASATHIRQGDLRALSINATSYSTGHAVSFFEGAPSLEPWQRTRRRGQSAALSRDHLLASDRHPIPLPARRASTTTTSWTARCASSRRCRRRSISARGASW